MKFKKTLLGLSLFAAGLNVSLAAETETVSVASTPVPAGEVLAFIKPLLAEQGINLEIHEFTDYIQPNQQVVDGQIDMNCYQHQPFLDDYIDRTGADLVALPSFVYLIPMAGYSNKIDDIKDLKDKATVVIPNDPTNGARALILMHEAGLIELKDPTNVLATPRDIKENPKQLKVKELEAASLPRIINDVDLAVINTNYALDSGLNPQKDSLFIENEETPYANLCATLKKNKDNPTIKKVVDAWHSPETLKFIENRFEGSVISFEE